jgi:hypothetical protein
MTASVAAATLGQSVGSIGDAQSAHAQAALKIKAKAKSSAECSSRCSPRWTATVRSAAVAR